MKSTKKLLSLLLVFVMVFSLAIPAFAEGETAPASLATWTESLVNSGANDVCKDISLTFEAVSNGNTLTNPNITENEANHNISATPWYGTTYYAEGTQYAYIGFALSTKGYENLSLDTVFGGNGRVPLTYKLMYSMDNETWVTVDSVIAAAANTADASTAAKTTVAIPAAAADQEMVYFRIAQASGATGNGNNAGSIRIYGMALTGTAVEVTPSPAPTDPVEPSPEPSTTPVEPGELDGKTVILHSNDVHGAIEGYANMAALKADYEAKGAKVIVVDAGDFSQGTAYVSTSKGLEAVNMMNAVGYDIAIPGNHEFDYGYEQLVKNLENTTFDFLCCNIFDADGKCVFTPSKVVEIDGVKIGFIGVNTPESQTKANPALIKGLKWLSGEDMVKAVQDQADALNADVTVVIAHLGVDSSSVPNTSYDLLKDLKGVDFIIDGHSHTVMAAGSDDANKQPIQSTGTAFANIGVVVIDNAKKAIESNELVKITEESAKDEAVAAAAKAIIDKIDAEYGAVFAKSEVNLNGERTVDENGVYGNRDGETNLGDLIADSMIWKINQEVSSFDVPKENIVAITNGGGIRAPIKAGDITKKDVNTVLPFGNTLAVVYVTGAELLEALEASTYCTPKSVGGFPQVAGIEMTINTDKVYDANENTYPGSTYHGPKTINRVTIDSINGKAFDAKATYAVVTNNFCAAGGDTYYAFARASAQIDTGIPLDEALMDYITTELKGVVGEEYADTQGRINFHEHDFDRGTCKTCGFAPFNDIADSGYWEYIVVGYYAGIANGYPDGSFQPNNTVTRGQYVTMLWRAMGEPKAENATLSFKDAANIPEAYKAAIAWGVEAGVIQGYADGTFRHGQSISRAQMATFSYRVLDALAEAGAFGDVKSLDSLKTPFGFKDEASVAAPYVDAVNVCANLGIILGFDTDGDGEGDTYRPNDTAIRGQAVTIIVRVVLAIAALAE